MNRNFLKWLRYSIALVFVVFAVYVNYLNNIVKREFSKPESANFITYDQQSSVAINMLLITEDQSFFEHSGVDFKEIVRVIRDYVLHDKPLRGASTLTQQLIKNSLLTRERTVTRKLKEVLMALLLEMSFDKQFILNRYMNSCYFSCSG